MNFMVTFLLSIQLGVPGINLIGHAVLSFLYVVGLNYLIFVKIFNILVYEEHWSVLSFSCNIVIRLVSGLYWPPEMSSKLFHFILQKYLSCIAIISS